jgi:hypothetical protein
MSYPAKRRVVFRVLFLTASLLSAGHAFGMLQNIETAVTQIVIDANDYNNKSIIIDIGDLSRISVSPDAKKAVFTETHTLIKGLVWLVEEGKYFSFSGDPPPSGSSKPKDALAKSKRENSLGDIYLGNPASLQNESDRWRSGNFNFLKIQNDSVVFYDLWTSYANGARNPAHALESKTVEYEQLSKVNNGAVYWGSVRESSLGQKHVKGREVVRLTKNRPPSGASEGNTSQLVLFDFDKLEDIPLPQPPPGEIEPFPFFDPSGKRIIYSTPSGVVSKPLEDSDNSNELAISFPDGSRLQGLPALLDDGKLLAANLISEGTGCSLHVYRLDDGHLIGKFAERNSGQFIASPDGRRVIVLGDARSSRSITLLRFEEYKLAKQRYLREWYDYQLNDERRAFRSEENKLRLLLNDCVPEGAFSDDGKFLFAGRKLPEIDDRLQLIRIDIETIENVKPETPVAETSKPSTAFSLDSLSKEIPFALANPNHPETALRVYKTPDFQPENGVKLSRDGRWLFSGTDSNRMTSISVLNLETSELIDYRHGTKFTHLLDEVVGPDSGDQTKPFGVGTLDPNRERFFLVNESLVSVWDFRGSTPKLLAHSSWPERVFKDKDTEPFGALWLPRIGDGPEHVVVYTGEGKSFFCELQEGTISLVDNDELILGRPVSFDSETASFYTLAEGEATLRRYTYDSAGRVRGDAVFSYRPWSTIFSKPMRTAYSKSGTYEWKVQRLENQRFKDVAVVDTEAQVWPVLDGNSVILIETDSEWQDLSLLDSGGKRHSLLRVSGNFVNLCELSEDRRHMVIGYRGTGDSTQTVVLARLPNELSSNKSPSGDETTEEDLPKQAADVSKALPSLEPISYLLIKVRSIEQEDWAYIRVNLDARQRKKLREEVTTLRLNIARLVMDQKEGEPSEIQSILDDFKSAVRDELNPEQLRIVMEFFK